MNKETYLQSKMSAFEGNITAHQVDLSTRIDTLCEHVGVSYLEAQERYEQRDFESTERIVEILNKQSIIRGTQHIFHKLHQLRNAD